MVGRPPKPAQVREIEGNRSKRDIPAVPEPTGMPKPAPALTAEEKGMFRDLVTSMPDGVYSQADSPTLERFVRAWARYRKCQREIDRNGLLITKTPSSKVLIRNPYLNLQREASDEMHRCSTELGLSPVARMRISAPKNVDTDPLELLLDGRQDGAYYTPAPVRRKKAPLIEAEVEDEG